MGYTITRIVRYRTVKKYTEKRKHHPLGIFLYRYNYVTRLAAFLKFSTFDTTISER